MTSTAIRATAGALGMGTRGGVVLGTMLLLAGLFTMVACAGASSGSGENPASPPSPDAASAPVGASSASASPARAADESPVLSDTGLGELRLGVSLKQAKALGLVGERTEESPDETCEQYTGAKGSGVHYLYFTDDQLIIIDVTQAAKLDTGLAIGSTYTQLHNAYGDQIGNDTGPGRIYVTAPGAPVKAEYRVALDSDTAFPDSKITEITLQTVDSGCYE